MGPIYSHSNYNDNYNTNNAINRDIGTLKSYGINQLDVEIYGKLKEMFQQGYEKEQVTLLIENKIENETDVRNLEGYNYVLEQIKKFDTIGNSDRNPEAVAKFLLQKIQNNEPCVICMSEFNTSSKVYMTGCTHLFHDDCYKQYKTSNNNDLLKCPTCRKIDKYTQVTDDEVTKVKAAAEQIITPTKNNDNTTNTNQDKQEPEQVQDTNNNSNAINSNSPKPSDDSDKKPNKVSNEVFVEFQLDDPQVIEEQKVTLDLIRKRQREEQDVSVFEDPQFIEDQKAIFDLIRKRRRYGE